MNLDDKKKTELGADEKSRSETALQADAEYANATELVDELATELGVRVLADVSATELTTFRGGGTVKRVYVPPSVGVFAEFMRRTTETIGVPPYVLGGGSDTLIKDGEVRRPVVWTKDLCGITLRSGKVVAECGVKISALIAFGRKHGLGGMEFLQGVPASVGGAVRMNAGAFGAETSDYIDTITCLSADFGKTLEIPRDEVGFGYRKGAEYTVVSATFALAEMSREESAARAAEFVAMRKRRQPAFPSCGSVFKGAELPAGYYIDRAGLKGVRKGGAVISQKHANFIVNEGGASAADYLWLADFARERVKTLFGVELQREFELLE